MVALPLYCFYFILHALNVKCIRFADEKSLSVMKFENSTGGYQFEVHLYEGFEIPCFVKSEVTLQPDWVSFIFQPFRNLRYGEVDELDGAEDLTRKHAMFAMLNKEHTYGKSVLYWQGLKSGLLWCIYNEHHVTPIITDRRRLYVEIYVLTTPTAEVALQVSAGATVRMTCDAIGPYILNASLTWYFRPSTWSFQHASKEQDLSDYTTHVVDKRPNQERQTAELIYKAQTSGLLECRSVVHEFPDADSSFFNLEVGKDAPLLCDECEDCEYVSTTHINDTSREKPTAELAIKVLRGEIVQLKCDPNGPDDVQEETTLSWHFRPITWSGNLGNEKDITDFSRLGTEPFQRTSELIYRAETSGTLECRATLLEAPNDSTFINLEVVKNVHTEL